MNASAEHNGTVSQNATQDVLIKPTHTTAPKEVSVELFIEECEDKHEEEKEAAAKRKSLREQRASCVQRAGSKVSEALETLFYK